jgi:hypothetical protein
MVYTKNTRIPNSIDICLKSSIRFKIFTHEEGWKKKNSKFCFSNGIRKILNLKKKFIFLIANIKNNFFKIKKY